MTAAWNWEDPESLNSAMDGFLAGLAQCEKIEEVPLTAPFPREALAAIGVTGVEFAAWKTKHPAGLGSDVVGLRTPTDETVPGPVYRVDGSHHFIQLDISKPLPFADGALDWVYAEHLIEHVTVPVATFWLAEVRRVLAPGGVLRLTTPDLARYVAGFTDGDEFFAKHRRRLRTAGVGPAMPPRRAFMVNQLFYLYGHRWIYDADELRYVLGAAGFDETAMTVCAYRQGQRDDVAGLDQTLRNDETIYVEISA